MKQLFLKQLETLVSDESDLIANLSNISAAINDQLNDINWVGFYRKINDELILGPFQGHVACVHIPIGKGVCGTAVKEKRTLRIDNVHDFPGHIACDSASNSEIVIPLYKNSECVGVLDIDSPQFNRFTHEDQLFLEDCARIIESVF